MHTEHVLAIPDAQTVPELIHHLPYLLTLVPELPLHLLGREVGFRAADEVEGGDVGWLTLTGIRRQESRTRANRGLVSIAHGLKAKVVVKICQPMRI